MPGSPADRVLDQIQEPVLAPLSAGEHREFIMLMRKIAAGERTLSRAGASTLTAEAPRRPASRKASSGCSLHRARVGTGGAPQSAIPWRPGPRWSTAHSSALDRSGAVPVGLDERRLVLVVSLPCLPGLALSWRSSPVELWAAFTRRRPVAGRGGSIPVTVTRGSWWWPLAWR